MEKTGVVGGEKFTLAMSLVFHVDKVRF